MKTCYSVLCTVLLSVNLPSQTILNAYAKVTAISNASVLTLSNVDQTAHTFSVGGKVIIMQMQDNVIGTNTLNTATYGNLSTIANVGRYEIGIILARNPVSGTPTTVTLSLPLTYSYTTGNSVQMISFRNLGTAYTTTSNITGLSWNGLVGGVIALETNTLTLRHRIIANAIGFRAGLRSAPFNGFCDPNTYMSSNTNNAFKAEGIQPGFQTGNSSGRGRYVSGGGGGNQNNAGGGGGSNYTFGGDGGVGANCTMLPSGGIGGVSLSAHISAGRVFMGGGGGGGQTDNTAPVGNASIGGRGGGIILLKANNLNNTGCSTPISISVDGESGNNSGIDGAGGGGGAAGSIVMNVNTYSVTAACGALAITAVGGGGGHVTGGSANGGGGGGGQGVILFSTPVPTINISPLTLAGGGGANCGGCGPNAAAGGGSYNAAVIGSANGPLPIELLDFKVETIVDVVKLSWTTATEKDNDYFTLEKSNDGIEFKELTRKPGAINSKTKKSYHHDDETPFEGANYYRLKQTDLDGAHRYFPVVMAHITKIITKTIFPNPINSYGTLNIEVDPNYKKDLSVQLLDMTGREVYAASLNRQPGEDYKINLQPLSLDPGIYHLRINTSHSTTTTKLSVQ